MVMEGGSDDGGRQCVAALGRRKKMVGILRILKGCIEKSEKVN